MRDGKGLELDGTDKKITYGIKKIVIKTNIHRVDFVDCAEEQTINKWEQYDVNWLDTATKKILSRENKYLMNDFVNLMKIVIKLKDFHETTIEKMLFTAHEIKRIMGVIQGDIDILENNNNGFKPLIKEPISGDDEQPSTVISIKGVEGS